MMHQSFPVSSLSDILDSCALTAMGQLIAIYAPEKLNAKEVDALCDDIARTSYYMAAAMMDARSTFHEILLEQGAKETAQEEESDET